MAISWILARNCVLTAPICWSAAVFTRATSTIYPPDHTTRLSNSLRGHAGTRCASSALKSARVALRKRFGQHLLKNADVVANIVACAKLKPTDRVFEVGPGTGNLTIHLLQQAAMVYAVELDRDMAASVTRRVEDLGLAHKFRCVNADVLKVRLPVFDAMVANIPYQISSPLLTRIFEHTPRPRVAIIMFQKEFGERMIAKPGTSLYCRLSVNSQLLSHSVKIVMRIGREQFRPPPKVDSCIVEIIPKGPPPDLDFEQWDAFLRLAFAGKNKTLRTIFTNKNTVAAMLHWRENLAPGPLTHPADNEHAAGLEGLEQHQQEDDGESDDIVNTAGGPLDRATLNAARANLTALLTETGLSDARANAMSIQDFMKVFNTLSTAGWKFRGVSPARDKTIYIAL